MEEKGEGEGVQCFVCTLPRVINTEALLQSLQYAMCLRYYKKNPLNLEWNGVLFGLNSSDVMVRLLIQKPIRFYFYLVSCRKTKKT